MSTTALDSPQAMPIGLEPSCAIRVRFIANHTWLGWDIRAWTGSLFEHVEFGTPEGTWIGAHAQGGVQERPAAYCAPFREYVYDIPCTPAQLEDLMGWARGKIGTPYNFLDIGGLLFQARLWTGRHQLICSQFVTDGLILILGASAILNVLSDWTYRITPEILHLSPVFYHRLHSRKG